MVRHPALHLLPLGLLVAATLAVAVHGVVEWRSVPWAGYHTAPEYAADAEGHRRITSVHPLSPASRAGLQAGDRLVSVEGHPPRAGAAMTRLRERLAPGDTLTIEVASDEGASPRTVTLTLGSQARHPFTIARLAASGVTFFAFLSIGLFVFLRRRQDVRARLLLWFSWVTAPAYLVIDAYAYRLDLAGDPTMVDLFRLLAFAVTYGCLSTALIGHFVLVFPSRREVVREHPGVLRLNYGLYALLAVTAGSSMLLMARGAESMAATGDMADLGREAAGHVAALLEWGQAVPAGAALIIAALAGAAFSAAWPILRDAARGARWSAVWDRPYRALATAFVLALATGAVPLLASIWLPGPLDKAAGIFGVITLTIGPMAFWFAATVVHSIVIVVLLIQSYRRSDIEERQQIRWPIWGLILYFGGATLLSAVQGFLYSRAFWLVPVTDIAVKGLAILVPLSFAFAIARYRLMDIDLVIRKSVVYASLTVLVGGLYLALAVGVGGLLAGAIGLEGRWSTLVAGVLTLAVFFPLRARVQSWIEGQLFRRRRQLPERLAELEQRLLRSRDTSAVGGEVARAIQAGVPNRAVVVLLATGRDDVLRPVAKLGDLRGTGELAMALDPTPLAWPLAAGRPLPIDALRSTGDVVEALQARTGARWILPIVRGERLAGIATLGRPTAGDEIQEPELDFLAEVGELAARRLDALALEGQAQDLEQARRIQRNLLPRSLPQRSGLALAARYVPCRDVGGDYYDVVALSGERVGLLIADVSGKGVPAALLMANCQAAFRSLSDLDLPPGELCTRLNEIMARNVAPEQFVTLCYGEVQPRTGTLTLVNAGHLRPALVEANGSRSFLEGASGLPLGILEGERYEETVVELPRGATLLLFTDGLTEAASRGGERFDEGEFERGLAELAGLPAPEAADRLLGRVERFGGGDFADDVTLILASLS
jgi:serine phosphatase RsbU (regulator of sigma subunit)